MHAVVAAAIVQGGRVLAARRTTPPECAGRWELPGGKVEPGETPDDALEREIAEELGCTVEVTAWLDGSAAIGTTHELRVASARLAAGRPEPSEHDLVRWLSADELDEVDWLEPDRPFLPAIAHLLRESAAAPRHRAVFFDEDDALAVQARLRSDGYDASLERERLAGEDDDEDHPWAVLTDAPGFAVELLVDEHDGWLDEDMGGPGPIVEPIDLPTAPRRIKRP